MRKLLLPFLLLIFAISAQAQNNVGIGTTAPRSSAMLEVRSTNQGILLPRVDTTQILGLTVADNGLIVFDTVVNSGAGDMFVWDGSKFVSLTQGGDAGGEPVGTIMAFAGGAVPAGYLLCDGTAVSRTTYSDLFTAIGTTWGAGDGSTTFNLPDLRGRFLRGQNLGSGNDPDAAGRTALFPLGATGDNVGSYQDDAFQGHHHQVRRATTAGGATGLLGTTLNAGSLVNNTAEQVTIPITDGTNGTPRISSETRPTNAYVQYIIKYQPGGTGGGGGGGGTVTSITAGLGLAGGTITTSGTIGLDNSGVTAGSYGSATEVPVITVDAFGRVTAASTSAVTGTSPWTTLGSNIYNDTSFVGIGTNNPTSPLTIATQGGTEIEFTGGSNSDIQAPGQLTIGSGGATVINSNGGLIGLAGGGSYGLVLDGNGTVIGDYPSSTINTNAELKLASNDKGLQLNRVDTTTLQPSLSALDNGLIVFDTVVNSGAGDMFVWDGSKFVSLTQGGDAGGEPVGTIMAFAGGAVPAGYLLCDGTAVSRTTYSDLFTAIGTTWGQGDGSTTFNLPDLRGRFLRGQNLGSGNDPNSGTRFSLFPGGAIGDNTGSYQDDATARPNNAFGTSSNGDHAHSITAFTGGGGLGINADNDPGGGNTSGFTNTAGAHTHSITTGGDAETRPLNAYVQYIIKYQPGGTGGGGGGGGTVTNITAGIGLTGGTITTSGTIGLDNSGVTAGSYGSSTEVPVITVDAFGRVTSASTSAVTGTSPWTTLGSNIYNDTSFVGIGTNNPTSLLTIGNSAGTEIEFTGAGTTDITSSGAMNITAFPEVVVNGGLLTRLNAGTNQLNINTDGIGINTTSPNANADLTLGSNDRGLQLNRVDTLSLSLGANDRGMVVYDTTDNEMYVWDGTRFTLIGSASGANDTIPANVFSARIQNNGTATKISESYPFIQSVSRIAPGVVNILFEPGFFTQTPVVIGNTTNNDNTNLDINSAASNSSQVQVITEFSSSGANIDKDFYILVQRQGADFQNTLTAPPNVVGYLQTNGSDFYLDTANLNIGGSASNPNADLTLSSTDKGLQLNKVDTADIFASLGAADQGLVVFDTVENQLFVWNGIKFEATGSGGGANDTIPANVFSARIENNGVVSILSESFPFIDNLTRLSTGFVQIDFVPGLFTETPSVLITGDDITFSILAKIQNVTSNGFTVRTLDNNTVARDLNFNVIVQRQGADYQNSLTAPPNVVGYWQRNGSDIYVDTVNNVGIGTNNPVDKLHVSGGNINIDINQDYEIGEEIVLSRTFSEVTVGSNLITPLVLRSGTEVARIEHTGEMAIGSSINPNATLTLGANDEGLQLNRVDRAVLSLGAIDRGMIVYDSTVNETFVWNGSAWESATAGGSSLWTPSGSDVFYTTGNVGIGTNAPTQSLDVSGGNINIDNSHAILQGGENLIQQDISGDNIFIGEQTGTNLSSGLNNTFIGIGAGLNTASASQSIFIGRSAGVSSQGGLNNIVIGVTAGRLITGSDNTVIGGSTGTNFTSGFQNTMIGNEAGFSNITGSFQSLFGFRADAADGIVNATAIGHRSSVTQSNSLVLGSINGVNGASADVNVGIGTTAPTNRLEVVGDAAKFDSVIIVNNAQAGYVLTAADATGAASWQPAAGGASFSTLNEIPRGDGSGLVSSNIFSNGTNVSINTTNFPFASTELFIADDNDPAVISLNAHSNTVTDNARLFLSRARGTEAARAAVQNGDWLATINFTGYDGVTSVTGANIFSNAAENWSPGSTGTYIGFSTTAAGATGAAERMRISSEGNVGIGTNNPLSAFQLGNTLSFFNSAPGFDVISGNLADDGGGGANYIQNGGASLILLGDEEVAFFTWPTGTAGAAATSFSRKVSIQAAGMVIGGDNPTDLLDVRGSIFVEDQGVAPGTITDRLYNVGGDIFWNGTSLTAGGASLWTQNGSDVYYNTGNVGIGTITPADIIQANSTSASTVALRLTNSTTGSTGSDGFAFGVTGTGNAFINNDESSPINISTNSVTRMTIDPVGNVGIGTQTPTYLLDIESASPAMRLYSSGNSSEIRFENLGSGLIGSIGDPGSSEDLQIAATNRLLFNTDFGTRGAMDQDGRLGLGTITPTAPLHVIASGTFNTFNTNGIYLFNPQVVPGSDAFITARTESGGGRPIFALDINNKGGFAIALDDVDTTLDFYSRSDAFGGAPLMSMTLNNRVGIGTRTPSALLDVNGDFNADGDIRRNETNDANVVPVALGRIDQTANIISGSNNYTVVQSGPGEYRINIFTRPPLTPEVIVNATLLSPIPGFITYEVLGGEVIIRTFDQGGGPQDLDFAFTVFIP